MSKTEHEKIMEDEIKRDAEERAKLEPKVREVTGTTIINGFLYSLTMLVQMFAMISMPIGIIYTTFAYGSVAVIGQFLFVMASIYAVLFFLNLIFGKILRKDVKTLSEYVKEEKNGN